MLSNSKKCELTKSIKMYNKNDVISLIYQHNTQLSELQNN